MLREGLLALMGVDREERTHRGAQALYGAGGTLERQNVGEYCRDAYLEECRAQFGSLDIVCATCPQ